MTVTDADAEGPHCRCGRQPNKRGKTCCQMCWIGYRGDSHSPLCRRRNEHP